MSDVNANGNGNNSQSQSFKKGSGKSFTSFINNAAEKASKALTPLVSDKHFLPIVYGVSLVLFILLLPIFYFLFYLCFFYYGVGGYLIPYKMTYTEDATSNNFSKYLKLKQIGRTRFAARLGNPRAQYDLAEEYYYGFYLPENHKKAFDLWLISARKGYVESQYRVGNCYEFGENSYKGSGVIENYAFAEKWYLKAARKGHAEAQFHLGFIYYFGLGEKEGVKRNDEKASYWWNKAAAQGNEDAIDYLRRFGKLLEKDSNSTEAATVDDEQLINECEYEPSW